MVELWRVADAGEAVRVRFCGRFAAPAAALAHASECLGEGHYYVTSPDGQDLAELHLGRAACACPSEAMTA